MNILKKFLTKTPVVRTGFEFLNKVRLTGTLSVRTLSPKEKAVTILDYAKKYKCKIFIETGTFKGDTVFACQNFFDELYSIELSKNLFIESQKRFSGISKVHILEGNSGEILPTIVKKEVPTLFWLDAHYSEGETARGSLDTPIVKELNFIFDNNVNGCILIDDARVFNGKAGYPKIKELKQIIAERNKVTNNKLSLTVKNDIIRIVTI